MAASVARHHLEQQPTGATSMMARVERLDLVLGYLEGMMQQQHRRTSRSTTTATSSPSTPAATGGGLMMTSDDSSAASTPRGSKSWRRASWCRPAKEALEEAQAKGTLVDRIAFLEDRVLKMEEDMDIITPEKMMTMSGCGHDATSRDHRSSSSKKKGLKSFVKSCAVLDGSECDRENWSGGAG
ncbi:hypothetical protein C2845_PM06G35530 [Panicum miliaceum]|uniref:Uncharacterized protein n=1 Tax=Panicum miliaceum TaxID=4540 RepID=A0A3L6RAZ2_PANMI|nr:hypothetical protein C2845_PM06G35530 [Panicum miliaceum]